MIYESHLMARNSEQGCLLKTSENLMASLMVILNLRKSPNGTLAKNLLFVPKFEKYNGTRKILSVFAKTSAWASNFSLPASGGADTCIDRCRKWGGQANEKETPG